MADAASSIARLITFRAGVQRHALAIGAVREVTRMPAITRVPQAPAALLGLANVRGTVIPVFSAAALLGGGDTTPARLIVIEYDGRAGREWLGLAVDEARQIVAAEQGEAADRGDAADLPDLVAMAACNLSAPPLRRAAGTGPAPLPARAGDVASTGLVVIALGNQEFALAVDTVETVLSLPGLVAPIPDAAAVVIGHTAFDGGMLPVLSLRALLSLPAGANADRTRVLVVRINNARFGLQVDTVRGYLAVADGLIDPVPQALRRGADGAHIRAICRLDGGQRLIGVLAADRLVNGCVDSGRMANVCDPLPCTGGPAITASDGAADEPLLIFRIGAEELAIPVRAVETIAAVPDRLTRLPGAPAFVEGVMNLRGSVVPLINTGQATGVPWPPGARRRMIVVRIGEGQAGFGVDAICGVVRADARALQPTADPGNGETRIFERLANLTEGRRIIPVFSPRDLLGRAEQHSLRALGGKDAKAEP